jgi:hypothetical protein
VEGKDDSVALVGVVAIGHADDILSVLAVDINGPGSRGERLLAASRRVISDAERRRR